MSDFLTKEQLLLFLEGFGKPNYYHLISTPKHLPNFPEITAKHPYSAHKSRLQELNSFEKKPSSIA